MDAREGLSQMIKEGLQVDSSITSPPYWSLRDYGIEPSIWDGDPKCEHVWELFETKEEGYTDTKRWTHGYSREDRPDAWGKDIKKYGFCSKCGAWRGALGLEPTFELYIKHLCDIYDLVWKVLKLTGTNWVNIGDTYSTQGGQNRNTDKDYSHYDSIKLKNRMIGVPLVKSKELPSKCLCLIPQRFAIEMVNRGWILRNCIVWHKPNAMPSSAKDRFTVDFEYIFFFVKSNKTQYWINEKTAQLVSKQPLGIKGIENIDWEWRECKKCLGTGIKHKKCKECKENGYYYDELLHPKRCPKCKGKGKIKQNKECKNCKGEGVKKYNFWRGRQYWFEQQREPHSRDWQNENWYNKQLINGHIGEHSAWKNDPLMERGKNAKFYYNPLGKNKRCVWTIPTQPNPESHFATFPPTLIEPMILSGCPELICKECEKPREKIFGLVHNKKKGKKASDFAKENIKKGQAFDKAQFSARCYPTDRSCGNPLPRIYKGYSDCECFDHIKYSKAGLNLSNTSTILTKEVQPKEFKAYSDCIHGSKWKPGIVLDPFAGVGTTLLTAWKLGRNYIGFDISKKYCEIAEKYLSKTRFKRLDDFIYLKNKEIEV